QQHSRQRRNLPDFDAGVETHDVCDQAVLRQIEILKFGRQPEAVEQAEDQDSDLCIRLEAQKAPEAVHIVKSLVDDQKTDNRVDHVRIGVDVPQNSREQRDAVA